MNKLKSILLVILALTPITALKAAAQIGSANVAATGGFSLNSGDVLTLSAQIVGCSGQVPSYNGTPIDVLPNQPAGSPFTANSSQVVNFTVPGNDKILCGGQNYSLYAITWKRNGFPAAPTVTYRLADATAVNLNTLTPTGFYPPNLANAAGFSCPSGTNLQGFSLFFVPNCGASVTTPMPNATSSGQLLVSPSAGSNWSLLGQTFYQQAGDTLASIEANCSSLCTYVVTSPQTITLSANHTLASTVNLQFLAGGEWIINGSFTLTIAGNVSGTLNTHFVTTVSHPISFGGQQALAPVEWFGAVGDWNGSSGTNNAVAIQACINAMTAGQCTFQAASYAIGSALSITKSNVGLRGSGRSVRNSSLYPSPTGSILITTSTTANLINVGGTSISNNIFGNEFNDFALERSAIATSATARGMQFNYVYGMVVDGVTSEDSPAGFYVHASSAQGMSGFTNDVVAWGYGGFTETTGSYCGFCMDSLDGLPNPSLRIRNVGVFSVLGSGATTYGLQSTGTSLEDLHAWNFETAGLSYGEFIDTAAGALSALDIHFWGAINDGCTISCIFIGTTGAPASVEFNGGWNFRAGSNSAAVIDLEGASNVTLSNMDIYFPTTGPGVLVNIGNNDTIIGNQFLGNPHSPAVDANAASYITVSDNQMPNVTATNVIQFTSVQHGIISNNNISGTGTNGILLDASTQGIAGLSSNAVNGTFTAAISDLGVNPTVPGYFQLGGNGTIYKIQQFVHVSGSPLCTAAANATCTYVVNFPKAFPDSSWNLQCYAQVTDGAGSLWGSTPKTTTQVTVAWRDLTGATNHLDDVVCVGFE